MKKARDMEYLREWLQARKEALELVAISDRMIVEVLAERPDLEVIGDLVIIHAEDAGDPAVMADELARMGVSDANSPC